MNELTHNATKMAHKAVIPAVAQAASPSSLPLAISTLIKCSQKLDAAIKDLESRIRKLEGRKNGRKK